MLSLRPGASMGSDTRYGFMKDYFASEGMAELHRVREVINSCIDLAMQNVEHGSLYVIETRNAQQNNYYTKVFPTLHNESRAKLSIVRETDKPIIKHLAELDGATIIDRNGNMIEFGATLKRQITFFGHGKRHAFALGTSRLKDTLCILASEEDKHVRLFKDGVCIFDIDSRTKLPSDIRHKISEILDSPLSKVLVASGIATSILTLNPIPAIVTITGSTVIVSYGFDRIKKFF